MADDLNLR